MNNAAQICSTISSGFSIGLCLIGVPSQIKLILKQKSANQVSEANTYMTAGFSIFTCAYGYYDQNDWYFWSEFLGSILAIILSILVFYYKIVSPPRALSSQKIPIKKKPFGKKKKTHRR